MHRDAQVTISQPSKDRCGHLGSTTLLWWPCNLVAHADPEVEVAALAEKMHYEHPFEIDKGLIQFKALMAKAALYVTGTEKKANFEICNLQQADLLEQRLNVQGNLAPLPLVRFGFV